METRRETDTPHQRINAFAKPNCAGAGPRSLCASVDPLNVAIWIEHECGIVVRCVLLAQSRPSVVGLAESQPTFRLTPHCAVYFAMPGPFELLPCWCNGLTGTLPCEARACWLSLPARIFRSFVRPLTSRSENSRASIDEIARVSDGGVNQRLQARRIKRKNTRGFLILRPTRKPPYERSVRRVSQDQSSADCL